MITKAKIIIYLKYRDADIFARCGTLEEKEILNDNDWKLIDDLIQDIHFLKSNLLSSEMKRRIEIRIEEYSEGDKNIFEKLFLI